MAFKQLSMNEILFNINTKEKEKKKSKEKVVKEEIKEEIKDVDDVMDVDDDEKVKNKEKELEVKLSKLYGQANENDKLAAESLNNARSCEDAARQASVNGDVKTARMYFKQYQGHITSKDNYLGLAFGLREQARQIENVIQAKKSEMLLYSISQDLESISSSSSATKTNSTKYKNVMTDMANSIDKEAMNISFNIDLSSITLNNCNDEEDEMFKTFVSQNNNNNNNNDNDSIKRKKNNNANKNKKVK